MTHIKLDPREVLSLLNLIPIWWKENERIFKSIFPKIAQHKFGGVEHVITMERLAYPLSRQEWFYGLEKKWMPFPAYYVLFPPLRYVP